MKKLLIGGLILSLFVLSCNGGGGNDEWVQWPSEIAYSVGPGGSGGVYVSGDYSLNFGNIVVTEVSYFTIRNNDADTGSGDYGLVSISGKRIRVRHIDTNQTYTLCTDWTVVGNTLTLIGGNIPANAERQLPAITGTTTWVKAN